MDFGPSTYRTAPRAVLPIACAFGAALLEVEPREQIFYGEFDGRRDKRVLVKIIGE